MLLALNDLHKSFATGEGPLEVLRGVSLSLGAGESVALTGESGSGKSTLLHLAGGLDTPDRGTILFEGRNLTKLSEAELASYRRQSVGLVFQQVAAQDRRVGQRGVAHQQPATTQPAPQGLVDVGEIAGPAEHRQRARGLGGARRRAAQPIMDLPARLSATGAQQAGGPASDPYPAAGRPPIRACWS